MKNNLKKFKILFILLFVVFYSCEKDLYDEALKPEINQKANVRTSNLKELFKDKEFVLSYKKIPKKTTSSSEFSRSTFEENNGFTIVDETVRIVETDSVTTYTLLIESDDNTEGNLENLVLYSELQDGELGYVIEYHSLSDLGLTEEEIIQNGIKNVDGILTDDATTSKVVFVHYWVQHCIVLNTHPLFCGGVERSENFTNQCGHWESGYVFEDESGGGSGGSGGGGTGETVDDGIGGGSGSGGISTSPVTLTPKQLRDKCVNKKLSTEQQDWLFDNPIADSSILQYLESTVEDEFQQCYDEEKIAIIKRWINLQIALDSNPNLLLDIPCDQIPAWQNLTQFTPPQSIVSKIEQLDAQDMFTDFEIQYIQDASGTVVNCDYFPVVINNFPTNPSTGLPFTPTQFLNHVRRFINSFIDTSYSSFSPSTITGINESAIWNSSNALGAILHIDIPVPLGVGDGSVVCSQHNNSSWIFTTIEVPYGDSQGEDGTHPVSGNREFGIFQNTDGSYTFYTRGVDRIFQFLDSSWAENITENPFENPDLLWSSLTSKVSYYVQNNGGNAITPISTDNKKWRPDWIKVKQYLNGQIPITQLGCN